MVASLGGGVRPLRQVEAAVRVELVAHRAEAGVDLLDQWRPDPGRIAQMHDRMRELMAAEGLPYEPEQAVQANTRHGFTVGR